MDAASSTLTRLGWTFVLVLWQTALLALLVAAWDRIRPAGASHRHRRAFLALLAAVPLGMLSFWLLVDSPTPLRELAAGARHRLWAETPGLRTWAAALPSGGAAILDSPAPRASAESGESAATASSAITPEPGPGREQGTLAALGTVGALWMVVAALLILRTAGGSWRAAAIRRRASPLLVPDVLHAMRALASEIGIAQEVAVLESPDVEAPIATGWRRPAVIIPRGLSTRLAPGLLLPLLAHELEHVRRKDPLQALAQALVEALVFFSPGVRWLASRARLAREQSCDDVAVRACGDPARFAAALGALVGVCHKPGLAVGAAAPCVADRIRRVLKGETGERLTARAGILLALALLATSVSGLWVATLSFADAAVGARSREDAGQAPKQGAGRPLVASFPNLARPTSGWAIATPLGSPVSLRGYATSGRIVERVDVRNVSERTISSLTLALVIELWPRSGAASPPTPLARPPARIVRANPLPVALAPGAATTISPEFFGWLEIGDWVDKHELQGQPVITVIAADLAGAGTWEVTPRPGARDYAEAFHVPKPFVSKALLDRLPSRADPMGFCHDDRGLEYSFGALVPVGDAESSSTQLACCARGVWRVWTPSSKCG